MNKEPFSIEYLKSALSINTHVGCALGCQYCIVDELGANGIEEILTPERAIERLTGSRFFIPGKTPVTLNNRSDPLLPKVRESTFGMLALLNERGYTNPKIIISKLTPTEREVELLDDSIGNNFFFITYSNLPKPIERPRFCAKGRTSPRSITGARSSRG
jgi:DNA repair photolyase